jgi:hypothetical protein
MPPHEAKECPTASTIGACPQPGNRRWSTHPTTHRPEHQEPTGPRYLSALNSVRPPDPASPKNGRRTGKEKIKTIQDPRFRRVDQPAPSAMTARSRHTGCVRHRATSTRIYGNDSCGWLWWRCCTLLLYRLRLSRAARRSPPPVSLGLSNPGKRAADNLSCTRSEQRRGRTESVEQTDRPAETLRAGLRAGDFGQDARSAAGAPSRSRPGSPTRSVQL